MAYCPLGWVGNPRESSPQKATPLSLLSHWWRETSLDRASEDCIPHVVSAVTKVRTGRPLRTLEAVSAAPRDSLQRGGAVTSQTADRSRAQSRTGRRHLPLCPPVAESSTRLCEPSYTFDLHACRLRRHHWARYGRVRAQQDLWRGVQNIVNRFRLRVVTGEANDSRLLRICEVDGLARKGRLLLQY